MKARDIVVGDEYVIDIAPRHPITEPKRCTIVKVEGNDITATYVKLIVPVFAGPAVPTTKTVTVPASRVIRTAAEADDRQDVEMRHVRWWREQYPAHVQAAAAAQRKADSVKHLPRPFPDRRQDVEATSARAS